MFNFWNREDADRPALSRRRRAPITIGLEQLEGREMLSGGLVLNIIPDDPRPLMAMPRPYVGSFQAGSVEVRIPARPRKDEGKATGRTWILGGRLRGMW